VPKEGDEGSDKEHIAEAEEMSCRHFNARLRKAEM
jgi:hypothetical protein